MSIGRASILGAAKIPTLGKTMGSPDGGGLFSSYWTALTGSVANATPSKIDLVAVSELSTTLPDKSAFIVEYNIVSSIELDVTKKILTLNLAIDIVYGDTISIIYTKPTANPLKLASGTEAPSFTLTGTNNVEIIAEYTTVYNALTTKPSALMATRQNEWLSRLVRGGVWSDLDMVRVLAQTVNTANEALIDWKDVSKVATLGGTSNPVFTANLGFQMLAAQLRYIDLIRKPSDGGNYSVNSACIIFISNTNTDEANFDVGTYDGTNYVQITGMTGGNTAVNIHGNSVSFANPSSIGRIYTQRINATQVEAFKNGLRIGTVQTAAVLVGLSSRSFYIGGRNNQGTADKNTSRQYSFVATGKALTEAKIMTTDKACYNYFNYARFGDDLHSPFVMSDHSESALNAMRATIRGRIWTGGYPSAGASSISTGVADPMSTSATNLASVDQLTMVITGIADRICYTWHPTTPNGKCVLFHDEHHTGVAFPAAFELRNIGNLIRDLIEDNYTVVFIPLPKGADGNEGSTHGTGASAPYIGVEALSYFLDSSIRILNEYDGDFTEFYMTGVSGGGWTTTMISALDTRISKAAPVAGSLPQTALDHVGITRDFEQLLIGLTDIVDYGDLYLMATTGNRKQNQYIVKSDEFFPMAAYRHAPYLSAIRAITSNFNLIWDDTTTYHTITTGQMTDILAFFNS